VERACRAIERSPGGPLRLDGLARGVGVAPRRLRRAFLDLLGLTPRQYAAARRLSDFKNGIRKGDNVTGALYDAGYGSSSRLYEDVQERLGMTPAVYRRGAAGVRIAFTTADSPLGRVLVGATERGIAAVALGDSDAGLEAALRAEYPRADIERDDAALAAAVRVVLQAVAGEAPAEDLPLDLQATAFQHRVWRELRRIPRGQTRSYGEIARRIGRPAAARAVARACATNRVALLVPCHRVVPGAGGTGGYRWGAERKRRLLEGEGAATPASRRRG
jgi:AraC family transcriptional regulator of adaptative response/methylated-DNA-[protein]-cysteine methyltransferase